MPLYSLYFLTRNPSWALSYFSSSAKVVVKSQSGESGCKKQPILWEPRPVCLGGAPGSQWSAVALAVTSILDSFSRFTTNLQSSVNQSPCRLLWHASDISPSDLCCDSPPFQFTMMQKLSMSTDPVMGHTDRSPNQRWVGNLFRILSLKVRTITVLVETVCNFQFIIFSLYCVQLSS